MTARTRLLSILLLAGVVPLTGTAATQEATLASATRANDLDGDGKADLTVYRPSSGDWYTRQSSTNFATWASFQWGLTGDVPVPGAYDGDSKTDVAVYRPATGQWFIRLSTTNYATSVVHQWGLSNDIPAPGDFDGDGRTDLAIYRPATGEWYIRYSSTTYTTFASFQWGLANDVPVPGDYDGDGKTDLAVFRPSNGSWFVRYSSTGYGTFSSFQWGLVNDLPVPGDYDGDGRTDLSVYRPSSGHWFVLRSSTNYTTFMQVQWGLSADVPVPADYDGDGKSDIAVFRPSSGQWYLLKSTTGFTAFDTFQWGLPGDIPTGPVSTPPVSNPTVMVEGPGDNTTVGTAFTLSGWAVDQGAPAGTGIDAVHVWAFPTNGGAATFVGIPAYGLSRPDIATDLGHSRFTNSGFSLSVTSANLPATGTYDVTVFGRSTVTGGFTVTRTLRVTVSNAPPAATLKLRGASTSSFNMVGGDVIFDVVNGAIGSPKAARIFVNDSPVPAASLQVTTASLQVAAILKEGRNDIVATAASTADGDLFSEVTLWAGNRTLTGTLRDENGALAAGATVTARLGDDETVTAVATTAADGKFSFTNVPNRTILLTAAASGNRLATLSTTGDAVSVTLALKTIAAPSPINNNDFSQSTAGWNIGTAPVTIIPHAEGLIAGDAPHATDSDMRVRTSGQGPQTVSRTFTIQPGTKNVVVRFMFITSEVPGGYFGTKYNDSFSVNLRSKNAGAAKSDAATMNGLGRGAFTAGGATVWRQLSLPVSVDGDVVQADFTVTNVGDGLFDSDLVIDMVTEKKLAIPNRKLHDIDGSPLLYLSGAPHTYYGGDTLVHGTLTVRGSTSDALTQLSLEVLKNSQVVATGTLEPSAASALLRPFGPTGTIQIPVNSPQPLFRVSSAQFASLASATADSTLELRIRARTAAGEELPVDKGSAGAVQLLTMYTGTNRTGSRDVTNCIPTTHPCGGDDWALPSVRAFAATMSGVLWNDFSNMNGGNFPIHKEHQIGRDIDGKFTAGYDPTGPGAAATATRMVQMLQTYGSRITYVYVTYDLNNPNDPFWLGVNGACIGGTGTACTGGRKASDWIIRKKDHHDHFHVRIKPQ
jgi:hypothetical protein